MRVDAPWTEDQVENLRAWQVGPVHQFTCPNDHDRNRSLVPETTGWVCPTCDYTQSWAHDFMLDGETLESMKRLLAE